jgi:hypothetical protein
MERKVTPLGKSYWNETGAYHKEQHELYVKLVPVEGKADTVHGEMLRAINRFYYDYCNNGNGNVCQEVTETCSRCYGSGEEDSYAEDDEQADDCQECYGEGKIYRPNEMNEYFQEMFDFLEANLPKVDLPLLKAMEKFALMGYATFSDEDKDIYNKVMDAVVHFILTTENKPLA